jgi:curved DNA-binding protein
MFVDYYAILELSFDAPQGSIKSAFHTQAMKWHPDRNPGIDTTIRMQQINEAYLILKDAEARQRYDQEYQRYQEFHNRSQRFQEQKREQEERSGASGARQQQAHAFAEEFTDNAYEVFDDTLNKWMSNARKQAVDLARQTIEDLKGMTKASGKAMGEAALSGVMRYMVFGIVMLVIYKACGR